MFIWELPDWPTWRFDSSRLVDVMTAVSRAQGRLSGRMQDLGFELNAQASLSVLTEDVLRTSEIEGERLNAYAVRSSVARRLGVDIGALAPPDRQVDGVVEVVLDATRDYSAPLTRDRLFRWHAALFPIGYSGMSRIIVGGWRDDSAGPMEVVSGPVEKRRVHFRAPPAAQVDGEVARFLAWFEAAGGMNPLIRAGLSHLWLVTIHPFDDGNGRIARAVGDMALARAESQSARYYSLSAQIQRQRADYYDMLERTQRGTLDVSDWLEWFFSCLLRAVDHSEATLEGVLARARFWQRWAGAPLNPRQIKLINRLLDGFEGKLTSAKWAAIAKCSPDTALRDINDLTALGILQRLPGGGRSTAYGLVPVGLPGRE
jgi:Fic family protein